MKKGNLFYDKHAKMKKHIFVFAFIASFVLLGAGLGILYLNKSNNVTLNLEPAYKNHLLPLIYLKNISNIYTVDILYISDSILSNRISWAEGANQLAISLQKRESSWAKFSDIYSYNDSFELINIKLLFENIDNKLHNILLYKDDDILSKFIKNDYYHCIQSIIEDIDKLIEVQFSIIDESCEKQKLYCKIDHNIGLLCIIISAIFIFLFLLKWKKCKILFE